MGWWQPPPSLSSPPPISRHFCYHLSMKRLLPVLMVFGVFLGSVVPEQTYAFLDLGFIWDPIKESMKEAERQSIRDSNKESTLEIKHRETEPKDSRADQLVKNYRNQTKLNYWLGIIGNKLSLSSWSVVK